ncbi:flavin reductase family protein [Mesorhizobium sp.]|uniref:flavin reductase family protein n=1 Tax=Mesorhizobium sp. TaxID=1871066 RepID=UPI000FE94037|nr:flavin reductase family protein [Mesorhizobium sp.]RWJ05683.1 MAG: flavin reductase [Mesorhizobium sp.]
MLQAMPDIKTSAHVASADLFKTVSSHWPSGVAVITTVGNDGTPHGLTMSAVISLSLEPMQYLISVDKKSSTLPLIKQCSRFCINFLNISQGDIGMKFASKADDKFAGINYRTSRFGLPLIVGAVSSITCALASVVLSGDHEILIGDVLEIEHYGGEPLVHLRRAFHTVASL